MRRLLVLQFAAGAALFAWPRRPPIEHELADVQERLVAILADLARGGDCTTIGDRIESIRRDIEGIRQRQRGGRWLLGR